MAHITQLENRWIIAGNVGMDNANALLEASSGFTIANNTAVDFAEVTDIDTAAISLMLEWKRRAHQEGQALKFINLPANLSSLAQLYGVADLVTS